MELIKLRIAFDRILGYDNTNLNDRLWNWFKDHSNEITKLNDNFECVWIEDYAYHYLTSCGIDTNDTSNIGSYCKWCGKRLTIKGD